MRGSCSQFVLWKFSATFDDSAPVLNSLLFLYREENCDVTLPWWQNFRITTIGSSSKATATATRTAKKQSVYIRKTTTLHVHYAILDISQPSLRDCDMKFLISSALFMEYIKTRQQLNSLFLFLNLDTQSFRIEPQKISPSFDKLSEIERERWSLKQCEFTF